LSAAAAECRPLPVCAGEVLFNDGGRQRVLAVRMLSCCLTALGGDHGIDEDDFRARLAQPHGVGHRSIELDEVHRSEGGQFAADTQATQIAGRGGEGLPGLGVGRSAPSGRT
jgi:hypothetical protein